MLKCLLAEWIRCWEDEGGTIPGKPSGAEVVIETEVMSGLEDDAVVTALTAFVPVVIQ